MAEPNDPKDKSKVSLDLNRNEPSKVNKRPQDVSQIKLRPQEAAEKKPNKSQSQTPVKPMRPVTHQTRAKQKSEKNSKPIFILAAVVITGILVSQYLTNKNTPALDAPRAAAPQMAAKSTKSVPTESPPKSALQLATVVDPNQGLREANLDQVGLEIDENGRTFFAVRVKPRYVCYPGDIEAIRNVVGSTGSVLLSLEPMADGGKSKLPITRTLSFNELTQGSKVSMPVDMEQTGVYGIYICGDAAGKKSCGGKAVADFNKILNHRDLDIAANSIFYYQFAVLGLDYATVYSGLPTGIPGAREQLKNRKPQRDWKAELDKASALMNEVKSLPPTTTVENKVVTLELELAMVNPDGSCR